MSFFNFDFPFLPFKIFASFLMELLFLKFYFWSSPFLLQTIWFYWSRVFTLPKTKFSEIFTLRIIKVWGEDFGMKIKRIFVAGRLTWFLLLQSCFLLVDIQGFSLWKIQRFGTMVTVMKMQFTALHTIL